MIFQTTSKNILTSSSSELGYDSLSLSLSLHPHSSSLRFVLAIVAGTNSAF